MGINLKFFCKYVQSDRSVGVWHIWGCVGIGGDNVGGDWEREGGGNFKEN